MEVHGFQARLDLRDLEESTLKMGPGGILAVSHPNAHPCKMSPLCVDPSRESFLESRLDSLEGQIFPLVPQLASPTLEQTRD